MHTNTSYSKSSCCQTSNFTIHTHLHTYTCTCSEVGLTHNNSNPLSPSHLPRLSVTPSLCLRATPSPPPSFHPPAHCLQELQCEEVVTDVASTECEVSVLVSLLSRHHGDLTVLYYLQRREGTVLHTLLTVIHCHGRRLTWYLSSQTHTTPTLSVGKDFRTTCKISYTP